MANCNPSVRKSSLCKSRSRNTSARQRGILLNFPSPLWGGVRGGGSGSVSGTPPEIRIREFRPPHKGEVKGLVGFPKLRHLKASSRKVGTEANLHPLQR